MYKRMDYFFIYALFTASLCSSFVNPILAYAGEHEWETTDDSKSAQQTETRTGRAQNEAIA